MHDSKILTHSPGPWQIQAMGGGHHGYDDWKTFCVRASNNVCLATVGEVDRWESQRIPANARLMVAAPELLKALLDLTEWGCTYTRHTDPNSPHFLLIAAREAIARATVGSPDEN